MTILSLRISLKKLFRPLINPLLGKQSLHNFDFFLGRFDNAFTRF